MINDMNSSNSELDDDRVETKSYTINNGMGQVHVTEIRMGPKGFKNLNKRTNRSTPMVLFRGKIKNKKNRNG